MLKLPLTIFLAVAAAPVSAIPVAIANAGFEARAFGEGGFAFGGVEGAGYGGGWAGIAGLNNNGAQNPTDAVSAMVPEGRNVAFAGTGIDADGPYAGGLVQRLVAAVRANVRYTLSVDVGRRADGFDLADFVVELLAGDTVLASGGFAPQDVAPGAFRTLDLRYRATAADTGGLGIRLRSVYDPAQGDTYRQTMFDNVRLDAAAVIPEPAAWMLMALGFGMTGRAMRRRGRCVLA